MGDEVVKKEGEQGGENKDVKDMVSKVDFEKLTNDNAKLQKDLEDVRMEVFSDTYVKFLDQEDKGIKKEEPKKEELGEDAWEKMTKKELFEKAKDEAMKEAKKELEDYRNTTTKEETAKKAAEVKAFAEGHEDFEDYRHVMHSFSLRPEHAHKTLNKLYEEAKKYVKRIHAGTTEAEKKKQQEMAGEKPSGNNESYEELRKLTANEAATKSLGEVKEKLGPIPVE